MILHWVELDAKTAFAHSHDFSDLNCVCYVNYRAQLLLLLCRCKFYIAGNSVEPVSVSVHMCNTIN